MEKRRKELAFLVVGVLLLGGAMYTTLKPRATPAAAEQPQQAAKAPAPRDRASAEADGPAAQETAEAKPEPVKAGRDPFKGANATGFSPSGATAVAAAPSSSGGSAKLPMPPLFGQATASGSGSLPALPFQGFAALGTGVPQAAGAAAGAASGAAAGVSPPVDDRLRVTGIIEGDPTIAILRKGEARYLVQVGDPVQGYAVESISGRRVVLAAGGQKQTLFLGGRL